MRETIKLGVEIATVDRIAELSAEIADLNAEKSELLNQLKAKGEGEYFGNAHYVTVTECTRVTHDVAAMKRKLSRQFLKANERVKTVVSATLRGYGEDTKWHRALLRGYSGDTKRGKA